MLDFKHKEFMKCKNWSKQAQALRRYCILEKTLAIFYRWVRQGLKVLLKLYQKTWRLRFSQFFILEMCET